QYAKDDASGKLQEMFTIVCDYLLLESLEGIGEMSLDHVEINRYTEDSFKVAASAPAALEDALDDKPALDVLRKAIESSPCRVDVARSESSVEKDYYSDRVVRIEGESS